MAAVSADMAEIETDEPAAFAGARRQSASKKTAAFAGRRWGSADTASASALEAVASRRDDLRAVPGPGNWGLGAWVVCAEAESCGQVRRHLAVVEVVGKEGG